MNQEGYPIMKKQTIILAILVLGLTLFAQEIQHEAVAINIEVQVRVFKGKTFIDNLTINDFEIYEEGVLQTIEAVYFIRKTEIIKKEIEREEIKSDVEKKIEYTPDLSRTFVLMFEIIEYLPKIGKVLDYFFESVISPGDSLIIATPTKTYNLNSKALERVSREEIVNQLKGKIRKDAKLGSSEYRSLVNQIRTLDRIIGEDVLVRSNREVAMDALRRLKDMTYFDAKKAADFADFIKAKEGQKQVFFFFQERQMPLPPYITWQDKMELLDDVSLDSEKLRHAFSDSSITCNFLYITNSVVATDLKEQRRTPDVESSMQSFRGFSEMADVTGGLKDTSANAAASFERAVDFSESYYLLYYSPKDYKADGTFKKIKIKVKGQNYRITHRSGYVAD